MPIKGLTDRSEVRFPRIGFIRKGGPKRERQRSNGDKYEIMGLDLDHFRFDSDDTDAMDAFHLAYGDEPKQINIFLPWSEVEDNFQAWKEEYSAGGLKHRCDGETCVLWQDTKDGTYHTEPKPCPGGCKEIGYLSVIIPELKRLAFVTVLTHSKHDIMELQSNLEAYRAMAGQLRGIPLVLRRVEREVSVFDEKAGKRVRRRKWLMHIETAPRWTKVMLSEAEYSAIPGHVRAALPAPIEAQYVIEGFATEQRIDEIDAMSDDERHKMLRSNVARMRGTDWEHFEGFGDEHLPPKQQPAQVITVERAVQPDPVTAANDTAFERLPSASQERAANNGKTQPLKKTVTDGQVGDRPHWKSVDDAVLWGFDQGAFKAIQHSQNAYNKLRDEAKASDNPPKDARDMFNRWYTDVLLRAPIAKGSADVDDVRTEADIDPVTAGDFADEVAQF